jgi:5-methylcytosine-specific restriction endonuclease McrA
MSSKSIPFSDQYKHPNWQKKRLEILEHDKFTCCKCGDTESQLHVHHSSYIKGRMLWEYQTSELITLCEGCHELVHSVKDTLTEVMIPKLNANFRVDGGFTFVDMYNLLVEIMYDKDISLKEYLESK